ncbi:hypothetical protein [Thalassotalea atypica]|uniref:hypothetical protein n=1 Tax=Thalassotalea atypica TaxID=2054316 RepID=UPI0025734599|nr:hypothetical protein [Thalassotalea atypica]
MSTNTSFKSFNFTQLLSYSLLLLATVFIFAIAESIRLMLESYELNSLYVSFCTGFILFVPLVSIVLHPFVVKDAKEFDRSYLSTLLANIGLVIFVQFLFFLIWITDAIAVYSMYVDQSSFLAQAFNISSESKGDFSQQFYVVNLLLAWFFALLSIVIGLLPCLVARLNNQGVIGNFVASFRLAKSCKLAMLGYALVLSLSVMLPLIYAKYVFLLTFPVSLYWLFMNISSRYRRLVRKNKKV